MIREREEGISGVRQRAGSPPRGAPASGVSAGMDVASRDPGHRAGGGCPGPLPPGRSQFTCPLPLAEIAPPNLQAKQLSCVQLTGITSPSPAQHVLAPKTRLGTGAQHLLNQLVSPTGIFWGPPSRV